MFSLICAWINAWVNNGEAGELRRHRAHYDVIVMKWFVVWSYLIWKRIMFKYVRQSKKSIWIIEKVCRIGRSRKTLERQVGRRLSRNCTIDRFFFDGTYFLMKIWFMFDSKCASVLIGLGWNQNRIHQSRFSKKQNWAKQTIDIINDVLLG